MNSKTRQQVSSLLTCLTLVLVGAAPEPVSAFQDQASSQPSSTSPTPAVAPLTADELDALVAPVALYPDALVAQVLGAAASPDQIAIAAYWLGENKNLTGTALAQAVDQQSWDPSVKALTQFPVVLNDLAGNLAWTSNLGQAFENQQSAVIAAVQAMRAKAQAAGALQSTPQAKVVQQDPQTIVIQPTNPDVVYVPQYNPTVVYGSPYVVPLYTPPVAVAAATVSFGTGVAIGASFGGAFSWGFHSWGCNWGGGGGGSVVFQHNTYIHNSTYIHNRTAYNNYHPWGVGPHGPGPYGPHPYDPNGFTPHGGGFGPNGDRVPTRDQPNGGRNGDRGLIGGNGGTQHLASDDPHPGQRAGNEGSAHWSGAAQPHSHITGNGNNARAEANRGRASMHPAAHHPASHRPQQARSQVHRGGGGERRR